MPAAAAAAEPAEQRRDGVAESHTVIQTHRKDGKGLLKVPNEVDKWRPHAAQPTTVKPSLERIDGSGTRAGRRQRRRSSRDAPRHRAPSSRADKAT